MEEDDFIIDKSLFKKDKYKVGKLYFKRENVVKNKLRTRLDGKAKPKREYIRTKEPKKPVLNELIQRRKFLRNKLIKEGLSSIEYDEYLKLK